MISDILCKPFRNFALPLFHDKKIEMILENDILLEGVRITAEFLLDAEADALCGAEKYVHSVNRMNWRTGRYKRKLQLGAGVVSLCVPHLRFLQPRPSMVKRFKRLQDDFIFALSDVYTNGARELVVRNLIKAMWTVSLPDALLATIARDLCAVLEQWRRYSKPKMIETKPAGEMADDAGLAADIFGVI